MSTRVPIPLVSTNADDVTVTDWRVGVGDNVTHKQILLEVTTDKAAFEIESPADGTLLAIYAPARSVVPVGYIVALLGNLGETDLAIETDNAGIVARHQHALIAREPALPSAPAPTVAGSPRSTPSAGAAARGVRATPKARRIAVERGVDLEQVQAATGASIITEPVLEAYLAGPHP